MDPQTESKEDAVDTPIVVTATLPGAASLGAYQAGAMAALAEVVLALRARGTEVTIGALGGSSAGAIVAALFSHGLSTGRDVPQLLRQAWVDEVDIDLLRNPDPDAPLAMDRLRDKVIDFLSDDDRFPAVHAPYERPIPLQIGLTSLGGYEAPVDTGTHDVPAHTFVDWSEFVLEPGHLADSLWAEVDGAPSLLDTVLTSASHPAGFEPRALSREAQRDRYRDHGVEAVPDADRFWFTDGGLVESRPIGRILSAAARHFDVSAAARRIHVVVDPQSSSPDSGTEWFDDGTVSRSWLDGLRRSVSIMATQALHDDLRGTAETNARLRSLDDLVDALADELEIDLTDDARARARRRVADWGGVADKQAVEIEVICPRWAADDDCGARLLAGDFAGTFGGFLDRSIRASDFALGWRAVVEWMPEGLGRQGLGEETVAELLHVLDDAADPSWFSTTVDGDGVDQLSAAGRWRLALLAAQFGRVLVRAALPSVRLPSVSLPSVSLPFGSTGRA